MTVTMESAVFMGKNYLNNCQSIVTDLTLRQMFDVSTRLLFEQDEICGVKTSQKFTVQIRRNTRNFHRKNSFYVDVQRHFLWNKRQ